MIYSSRAVSPMTTDALEVILDDARRGNENRGITGALIYADGIFLQVLEGEREVDEPLAERIRADTRHEAMKIFHAREVDEPAFDDWRMAYLAPSTPELARWAGLEGTTTIDELLGHVQADAALIPKILVSIVEALAARSRRD